MKYLVNSDTVKYLSRKDAKRSSEAQGSPEEERQKKDRAKPAEKWQPGFTAWKTGARTKSDVHVLRPPRQVLVGQARRDQTSVRAEPVIQQRPAASTLVQSVPVSHAAPNAAQSVRPVKKGVPGSVLKTYPELIAGYDWPAFASSTKPARTRSPLRIEVDNDTASEYSFFEDIDAAPTKTAGVTTRSEERPPTPESPSLETIELEASQPSVDIGASGGPRMARIPHKAPSHILLAQRAAPAHASKPDSPNPPASQGKALPLPLQSNPDAGKAWKPTPAALHEVASPPALADPSLPHGAKQQPVFYSSRVKSGPNHVGKGQAQAHSPRQDRAVGKGKGSSPYASNMLHRMLSTCAEWFKPKKKKTHDF